MGQNKDAAVGFIGIGVIIVIIVGVIVLLLPSEPEKEPDFEKIREQQWIEHDKESEEESQLTKQKEIGVQEKKLSTEELQKIIAGFESYNRSVKILLDACVAVESEGDFIVVGQLITEHGEKFLQTTSGYGALRDRLVSEGYGDHPELGPLMNQSVILVDGMSTCMEVLAWEFSG